MAGLSHSNCASSSRAGGEVPCPRSGASRSALDRVLLTSNEELLGAVLCQLDGAQLQCSAGIVSWAWARAAEEALRARCEERRWQQPRSQRLLANGAKALFPTLKWRQLHLKHACRGCCNETGTER